MTVAEPVPEESTSQGHGTRKLAQDGRYQDNYLDVPVEVLFDQSLTEGAIALWILLSDIGLRLYQGVTLDELMTKLPCRRRSLFVYMEALQDRGLLGWAIKGRKYFFTQMPLEWAYDGLSNSRAPAPHAVIHDGSIPFRAKLMLFALRLYNQDGDLFVSQAKLDKKLHWGLKTIQKWLAWLEDHGYQTVQEPRQRRRRNGKWTSLHRDLTATTDLYFWAEKSQGPTGTTRPSAGMGVRLEAPSAGMGVRLKAPSAGMGALITPYNPKNSREPHQPPAGGTNSQEKGSLSGRRIRLVRVGAGQAASHSKVITAQSNRGAPEAQGPSPARSPGSSAGPVRSPHAPQARRKSRSTKRTAPRSTPEQLHAKPIPDWDAVDLADHYAHRQDLPHSRMSERNPSPGDYAGARIDYEKLSAGIQELLDAGNHPYDVMLCINHFHQHYGNGLLNCPWALFLFRARNQIKKFARFDPASRHRRHGENYWLRRHTPTDTHIAQDTENRRIQWEKDRAARAEARAKEEGERKAREAEEEARQERERAEEKARLAAEWEEIDRKEFWERVERVNTYRSKPSPMCSAQDQIKFMHDADWLKAHADLFPDYRVFETPPVAS
jgi:hypothetical protein